MKKRIFIAMALFLALLLFAGCKKRETIEDSLGFQYHLNSDKTCEIVNYVGNKGIRYSTELYKS